MKADKFLNAIIVITILAILWTIFYITLDSRFGEQEDREQERVSIEEYREILGIDPDITLSETFHPERVTIGLFQEYRNNFIILDNFQSPYTEDFDRKEIEQDTPVLLILDEKRVPSQIYTISSIEPQIREINIEKIPEYLDTSLLQTIRVIWVNNSITYTNWDTLRNLLLELKDRTIETPYTSTYSFRWEQYPILAETNPILISFQINDNLSYIDTLIFTPLYTSEESKLAYDLKATERTILDETLRREWQETQKKNHPLLYY